ncbi:MAG: 4-hydroxy-tetrahydrodipicolinate synthase [Planctomycetota bacterium]
MKERAKSRLNFSGLYTAVITPFAEKKVDYFALSKIFEYQNKDFIKGLIIAGTTGEGCALTLTEKENLFNFARTFYKNKILIAGISSFSFYHLLEEVRIAVKIGMDGLLVTPPVYLKTNRDGIEKFYKTVVENSRLPVIIYNVPSRTGYNLDIDILERLNKIDLVFAIKECSGNFEYVLNIKKYTNLSILCGDDLLYLLYLMAGADGIVSVVSNIFPHLVHQMQKLFLANKIKRVQKLFSESYEFIKSLFLEPNPIPIKFIMSYEGFCKEIYKLPLVPPSEKSKAKIISAYKKFKKKIKELIE